MEKRDAGNQASGPFCHLNYSTAGSESEMRKRLGPLMQQEVRFPQEEGFVHTAETSGFPQEFVQPAGAAGYPLEGFVYPAGTVGFPQDEDFIYPAGAVGFPQEEGFVYPTGEVGYPQERFAYPAGAVGFPQDEDFIYPAGAPPRDASFPFLRLNTHAPWAGNAPGWTPLWSGYQMLSSPNSLY